MSESLHRIITWTLLLATLVAAALSTWFGLHPVVGMVLLCLYFFAQAAKPEAERV